MLAMLLLGFSAGLPFYLVFQTLSAWLRQSHVDRATIGMLAWVGTVYSLKFLWAPIVDRLPLPLLTRLLGRRRSWMLLAQAGIALGLVNMAHARPGRRRDAAGAVGAVRRLLRRHAGHRHRCLAHRVRGRDAAGRDGGRLPDRLSHRR